ncbi:MAG: glycoside hydrolase family 25 protein [Muribaculaceae bacterium]|nr:glycoside hydrolase family 25 protein [Muribaculaceae bacterium]
MKYRIIIILLGTLCSLVAWFVIEQFTYHPVCSGIDVSHYNHITSKGRVPTSYSVADSSLFIIAKATEGSTLKDSKFYVHRQYARNKNIKFGAYHFLTRGASPKEQFEHFKRVVGHNIDIIPCLDVERYANKTWTYSQARKYVKEWSKLCKEHYGVNPIIYCTDWYRIVFFYDMPNQFWINNWYFKPLTACAIHQYTNNGETLDYNHLNTNINNLLLK